MAKYKIWDKKSDILTLGPDSKTGKYQMTAEEYIENNAPWAAIEGVKVIVADGVINGMVFMEYGVTVEQYKRMGAVIDDDMTDEEVLAAIEAFEDAPPLGLPSAEERIAAALEAQILMSL